MNVESFEDERMNFVEVQAYTRSTGDLDSDGYEFTLCRVLLIAAWTRISAPATPKSHA